MQGRKWTEKEKQYLREHYRDMPYPEIAKYLGRTVHAVEAQVGYLGLQCKRGQLEKQKVDRAWEMMRRRQEHLRVGDKVQVVWRGGSSECKPTRGVIEQEFQEFALVGLYDKTGRLMYRECFWWDSFQDGVIMASSVSVDMTA